MSGSLKMTINSKIKKDLVESAFIKMRLAEEQIEQIETAVNWVLETYQEGGKVVLFGNGGSAADAQHIAGELVNYFKIQDRPMLDCLSLTTNTSILTAISNDTSYDNVFAKQIESLVTCKDVLIALSTSGNSKNIIRGIETGKRKGAKAILLTGKDGGKAALIADLSIKVPSTETPRIQESHIAIGHIICDIVENELFKEKINSNQGYGCAPLRIHFGEGADTDYYVNKIGWGCVNNATLENYKYECKINKIEEEKDIIVKIRNYFYGLDETEKEAPKREYKITNLEESAKNDLIAATVFTTMPEFKGEITIEHYSPAKSGLGGSSALVVSIIKALYSLQKIKETPEKIAKLAYFIERDLIKIKGGYQDQYTSAYSNGFNYMEFKKAKSSDKDLSVNVEPLNLDIEKIKKIEDNIVFFCLDRSTNGTEIHEKQKQDFEKEEEEFKNILLKKRDLNIDIKEALISGNLKKLGELLVEDHTFKKILSPSVTNITIERIYEKALNNGAYGGSICGAGSGGCMFFICENNKKEDVIKIIQEEGGIYLPISFTKQTF